MEKDGKLILLLVFLLFMWSILFVVLHEEGHRSIYYDFGINSTISFSTFGACTIPESNTTISETIILAHAIHESISVNTLVLCVLIVILYIHYIYVHPKN